MCNMLIIPRRMVQTPSSSNMRINTSLKWNISTVRAAVFSSMACSKDMFRDTGRLGSMVAGKNRILGLLIITIIYKTQNSAKLDVGHLLVTKGPMTTSFHRSPHRNFFYLEKLQIDIDEFSYASFRSIYVCTAVRSKRKRSS